jgi:large conductance mechanosensitive channel
MSMIQEFKSFAMKGNVADMAVGIIIGAAFGKIVSSMVNDVIMPPLGLVIGGVDFSSLGVTLRSAADGTPATVLKYGVFINTIVDFIIVALAIFLVVRGMNALRKKQEEAPAAPPAPSKQEVLLGEIRDLLKAGKH